MTTLCIVGLGLMGASLAMAVRPHYERIVAVTRRDETARKAVSRGIVDVATTDLDMAIPSADLIVLAAPVRTIVEQLRTGLGSARVGAVVTDLGSTKREIMAAMDALPPGVGGIGSHPMCGKELSGLDAADEELYRGRPWVLTRGARTDETSFMTVKTLAENAGARTLELDADRHDALVAMVSHLPFSLASALITTVDSASLSDAAVWQIAAGGLRDTTRVAASDVAMMLDILLTNSDAILASVRDFQFNLDQFASLLERRDEAGLRSYIALAAAARRQLNPQ